MTGQADEASRPLSAPEPVDVDLVAASLRADSADVVAYLESLAQKLEAALPGRTRVLRRAKGLLSRTRVVREIEVDLGERRYALIADGHGDFRAQRKRVVRGVALKTDEIELTAWTDALAAELAGVAQGSEQARLALEQLLL